MSLAHRSIALLSALAWLGVSVASGGGITVRADPSALTWSAFQTVDSLADSEDAHIAAEMSFPQPLRMERLGDTYRLPPFQITVSPDPARTRVRLSVARSAMLLRHEQGHYDIVVLAARALARELTPITASSAAELSRLVKDAVTEHVDRAERLSQAYDRQTDHGRDLAEQGRWSDDIAKALTSETAGELQGMPL